jgi:hypothetical protein
VDLAEGVATGDVAVFPDPEFTAVAPVPVEPVPVEVAVDEVVVLELDVWVGLVSELGPVI